MKIHLILAALLLPAIAVAQQPAAPKADPRPGITYQPLPDLPILLQQPNAPAGPTPHLQWFSPYQKKAQPDVRVNLNLRNASLKDALKQITEQTKREIVLDKDVPDNAKITVSAKNIRFMTALDILADEADLHVNPQVSTRPEQKEVSVVYHLGKKASGSSYSPFLGGDSYWFDYGGNKWNANAPVIRFYDHADLPTLKLSPNRPFELTVPANPNGKSLPLEVVPDKTTVPQVKLLNDSPKTSLTFPSSGKLYQWSADTISPQNYSSYSTLLSGVKVTEEHSTFTCPHCKQQVTVIHQHAAPKCEKCSRVFHDDWQFCPFDGAKRPATAGIDWQFCPLCGKSIKEGVKVSPKMRVFGDDKERKD